MFLFFFFSPVGRADWIRLSLEAVVCGDSQCKTPEEGGRERRPQTGSFSRRLDMALRDADTKPISGSHCGTIETRLSLGHLVKTKNALEGLARRWCHGPLQNRVGCLC